MTDPHIDHVHVQARNGGKTAQADETMATGDYVRASDLIPSDYRLQLDIDTLAFEAAINSAWERLLRQRNQARLEDRPIRIAQSIQISESDLNYQPSFHNNPWRAWSQYGSYRSDALRAVQPAPDPIGDITAWVQLWNQRPPQDRRYESVWGRYPRTDSYVSAPVLRDEPGYDAHSKRFDLEATKVCWKKVVGLECGEPSDPDSETGICKKHREEIRDKVKT